MISCVFSFIFLNRTSTEQCPDRSWSIINRKETVPNHTIYPRSTSPAPNSGAETPLSFTVAELVPASASHSSINSILPSFLRPRTRVRKQEQILALYTCAFLPAACEKSLSPTIRHRSNPPPPAVTATCLQSVN